MNGHLSNREVAEQEWILTHVEALALTDSGFTRVILPMDEDLRQSYRSVATSWELTFSRLFQPPSSYPKAPFPGYGYKILNDFPVIDEILTVIAHLTVDHAGQGEYHVVARDIGGNELSRQFIGEDPLEPDELGNAIAAILATVAVGLARAAITAAVARLGAASTQVAIGVARAISPQALQRTLLFLRALRARAIVNALRSAGKEVIGNIGGEGSKGEIAEFGDHIAINDQVRMSAAHRYVPNLIKEPGENIGELFENNSLDKVVSRRLDISIDTDRVARGAFNVLKSGGKLDMHFFSSPGNTAFGNKFLNALIDAGFKDPRGVPTVRNIGNSIFIGTKP